jgi:hypothetical protein
VSLVLPAAAGTVLAGTNNSLGQHQPEVIPGLSTRYNEKIYDQNYVWASSAAAGTVVSNGFAFGQDRIYAVSRFLLLVIRNPSTQTALTASIQTQYIDGGNTRYAPLSSFFVSLNNGDGESYLISGGLMAQGIRLSLSNNTVLNSSGGFNARVVVYHL